MDKTKTAADEKAVKDIIQTVETMINAFDNHSQGLVHLASGTVASPSVRSDMKTMHEKGEQAAVEFMKSNIVGEEPDIYTSIRKTKLQTFSLIGKSKKIN